MTSRSRFAVYLGAQADGVRSGWLLARLITDVTLAAVTFTTMVLLQEHLEIAPVAAKMVAPPRALAEPIPETITQPQAPYPGGCSIAE